MSSVNHKSNATQVSLNKLDYKIDKLQKESNILDRDVEYYNKNITRCNKSLKLNDLNTANKGLNKTQTRKQEVVDELAKLHQERTSLVMSNPEKHSVRTLTSKKSPPRKSAKVSPVTPPRSMFTKMSQSIKRLVNPNGGGKQRKRSKNQTMKKYKH
jgi:peptidoglycan hydrolase CwlO-like protein